MIMIATFSTICTLIFMHVPIALYSIAVHTVANAGLPIDLK